MIGSAIRVTRHIGCRCRVQYDEAPPPRYSPAPRGGTGAVSGVFAGHGLGALAVVVHIGFSGSSRLITEPQEIGIAALMVDLDALYLHHGDCIHGDALAHQIGLELSYSIIIHPPVNPAKRAFCIGAIETYPMLPYLERNRFIVDSVGLLIAAPFTPAEELRSGTWATIRYARKRGVPVWICWPNGSVSK